MDDGMAAGFALQQLGLGAVLASLHMDVNAVAGVGIAGVLVLTGLAVVLKLTIRDIRGQFGTEGEVGR